MAGMQHRMNITGINSGAELRLFLEIMTIWSRGQHAGSSSNMKVSGSVSFTIPMMRPQDLTDG
jgi:hypothetical protein